MQARLLNQSPREYLRTTQCDSALPDRRVRAVAVPLSWWGDGVGVGHATSPCSADGKDGLMEGGNGMRTLEGLRRRGRSIRCVGRSAARSWSP